ncbi:MAG: hypothetical protein FWC67_03010 [Defluviitaleaceae bacterium]|nr:hypothetical protein [Defluviitaleaceae bacterium]
MEYTLDACALFAVLNGEDGMLNDVIKSPVRVRTTISNELLREAGRFKATYKISLADSIALATATTNKATLLTSDHHEFDIIESNEKDINFCWIR